MSTSSGYQEKWYNNKGVTAASGEIEIDGTITARDPVEAMQRRATMQEEAKYQPVEWRKVLEISSE